jgi:hypothetical protein
MRTADITLMDRLHAATFAVSERPWSMFAAITASWPSGNEEIKPAVVRSHR